MLPIVIIPSSNLIILNNFPIWRFQTALQWQFQNIVRFILGISNLFPYAKRQFRRRFNITNFFPCFPFFIIEINTAVLFSEKLNNLVKSHVLPPKTAKKKTAEK